MKKGISAKYITDENGKKTAVIIDIKDYDDLLSYIEDMEDANELLKAEATADGFTRLKDFEKELIEEGYLNEPDRG